MTLAPLDPHQQRRHKRRNKIQTIVLVSGSLALLAACAWLLWGPAGLIIAAIAGAAGLWAAWRASPTMMLKLYRARALTPAQFPDGYRILQILAERAGLPSLPTLYLVPSKMMNAFAVGTPGNAVVAVTDGLLRGLNERQFAAVLAHEISHVRNEDVKVMALADVVSRMTSSLSTIGLLALVLRLTGLFDAEFLPWTAIAVLIAAPTIGGLLQLALSRAREFDADLDAIGLTGDPEGLASALVRLEKVQGRLWESLALPGSRSPEPSILRSHPTTEERVKRLLSLRQGATPHFDMPETRTKFPPDMPQVMRHPRIWMSGLWY
jgi:heat shock protein HtpX